MHHTYYPPRRKILLFYLPLLAFLVTAAGFGFARTSTVRSTEFILHLLIFLTASIPVPLLLYHLYAGLRAVYQLTPDNLSLTWGLRYESVPLASVDWVSHSDDIDIRIPLYYRLFPGVKTGMRLVKPWGEIEFMATSLKDLVFIASESRIFAISPEDPAAFIQGFQQVSEVGSLLPAASHSIRPGYFLREAWSAWYNRLFLLGGVLANIALFLWSSLILPAGDPVTLMVIGEPPASRVITSTQVYSLPLLSMVCYFFNVMAGLFFYRSQKTRLLALLFWANSLLVVVLFFVAVFQAVT